VPAHHVQAIDTVSWMDTLLDAFAKMDGLVIIVTFAFAISNVLMDLVLGSMMSKNVSVIVDLLAKLVLNENLKHVTKSVLTVVSVNSTQMDNNFAIAQLDGLLTTVQSVQSAI